MAELTFFARQDSTTASNASLNPMGGQAETITFTDAVPGGDLIFDPPGPGDAPLPDPDTRVIIGGVTYEFTVLLTGTLPTTGQGTAQLTGAALALRGREVMAIRVVVNGVPLEYFFVLGEPPATQAKMDAIGNGAISLLNVVTDVPCFCSDTDIATPSGDRKIETLRAGDTVLTEDGRAVQIAWIGASHYSQQHARDTQAVRPVTIRANAFGAGLPRRDPTVSPQHRIVVEGPECELLFDSPRVFVIARHLPDAVAHSPDPEGDVSYYHILLENHEILLANGLPVESFQPARRMVEALSGDARATLDATLDVLGAEAMLTRPDALPTRASYEAHVLSGSIAAQSPLAALAFAAAAGQRLFA
ncbi:Hint domain-containing protein [Tabrizicola sp.]|uniref:Hint domain-containing protein n=1 Tax=Tabrizicola sp. TaxID=2005166 RepID=UPI0026110E5C|nr:Hint domain-containing protein [Tabrizicola sp.]MDM7931140.1 Hint domain-containing protein [Tabrizicola sp.]